MQTMRIGWGSAYADDNLEPGHVLAQCGRLDYLCFDALAERTLALSQQRKLTDASQGYDVRLKEFGQRFLPFANEGLGIISNMGAANPLAAARILHNEARAAGYHNVKVAAVLGDDVKDIILNSNPTLIESGQRIRDVKGVIVSANAYIGADGVVAALKNGANVIIGGRIADPSLALAPLVYQFGWEWDDWERLGRGIIVGHVLECGTHATGGNFADPPYRIVPDLDNLGMPIAEVDREGDAVFTKLPQTGGLLSIETIKAQLVYEVHDPARYLTPDVVADFTGITLRDTGRGVSIRGGYGTTRPSTLKVLVGVDEGFMAEAEVSFAGPGAYDRAQLARDVLVKRLRHLPDVTEVRFDFVGLDAIHGSMSLLPDKYPYEVRLRVAAKTPEGAIAQRITREVEWQYFGPSGGGGIRQRVSPALSMYSTFIDRSHVNVRAEML